MILILLSIKILFTLFPLPNIADVIYKKKKKEGKKKPLKVNSPFQQANVELFVLCLHTSHNCWKNYYLKRWSCANASKSC